MSIDDSGVLISILEYSEVMGCIGFIEGASLMLGEFPDEVNAREAGQQIWTKARRIGELMRLEEEEK